MKILNIIKYLLLISSIIMIPFNWKISIIIFIITTLLHALPKGPNFLLSVLSGYLIITGMVFIFINPIMGVIFIIIGFLLTIFRGWVNNKNKIFYSKNINPALKEEWEEFKNQKIDILANEKESIIEMIDQFMIPDNINVTKFVANYMILKNGSREIYSASSKLNNEPDLSNEGTFSIEFFSPIDRPLGYPLWFIAGYPDVVKWFSDLEEEKIISIVGNLTQDSADEDGHLKLFVLRKMVDAYKLTNELECLEFYF